MNTHPTALVSPDVGRMCAAHRWGWSTSRKAAVGVFRVTPPAAPHHPPAWRSGCRNRVVDAVGVAIRVVGHGWYGFRGGAESGWTVWNRRRTRRGRNRHGHARGERPRCCGGRYEAALRQASRRPFARVATQTRRGCGRGDLPVPGDRTRRLPGLLELARLKLQAEFTNSDASRPREP